MKTGEIGVRFKEKLRLSSVPVENVHLNLIRSVRKQFLRNLLGGILSWTSGGS